MRLDEKFLADKVERGVFNQQGQMLILRLVSSEKKFFDDEVRCRLFGNVAGEAINGW